MARQNIFNALYILVQSASLARSRNGSRFSWRITVIFPLGCNHLYELHTKHPKNYSPANSRVILQRVQAFTQCRK